MIIIGEGVIGSTKTAGALWPTTSNPSAGGVVSIVCIIIMLMLMWQLYFDNHPHGHYGTIKQQCSFGRVLDSLCLHNITITTPQKFVTTVNATVQKLKIEKYDPRSYDIVQEYLNHTLPGSDHLDATFCDGTSEDTTYSQISYYMFKGIYARFDIAPPEGKKYGELDYAHTFRTTFIYLWSSVALSMLMLLIFLWIVRTKKRDLLEYFRLGFRLVLAIISFGIGCLIFSPSTFLTLVTSPFVVMLICLLMLAAILFDRAIRILGVWNFKKKYAIPPPEAAHDGHGDHDHLNPVMGTPHESYKMEPTTTVHPYPINNGYAGVPQAAPQGYYPHNPQPYAQTSGYSH
ncbi:hypothetical protein BJ875DRAFT_389552 [Amylocarpus encephaloides]|uniref:Uncharacterized protein n=1 Tax=Amylocarpus encephaloides TaxID=45428 RepID=A0A9P7Y6V5_9HELO|nr:hypothetical protein BJ875DRAFT_389552 [Amylocarpus encephaloides]